MKVLIEKQLTNFFRELFSPGLNPRSGNFFEKKGINKSSKQN